MNTNKFDDLNEFTKDELIEEIEYFKKREKRLSESYHDEQEKVRDLLDRINILQNEIELLEKTIDTWNIIVKRVFGKCNSDDITALETRVTALENANDDSEAE